MAVLAATAGLYLLELMFMGEVPNCFRKLPAIRQAAIRTAQFSLSAGESAERGTARSAGPVDDTVPPSWCQMLTMGTWYHLNNLKVSTYWAAVPDGYWWWGWTVLHTWWPQPHHAGPSCLADESWWLPEHHAALLSWEWVASPTLTACLLEELCWTSHDPLTCR